MRDNKCNTDLLYSVRLSVIKQISSKLYAGSGLIHEQRKNTTQRPLNDTGYTRSEYFYFYSSTISEYLYFYSSIRSEYFFHLCSLLMWKSQKRLEKTELGLPSSGQTENYTHTLRAQQQTVNYWKWSVFLTDEENIYIKVHTRTNTCTF